MPLFWSTCPYHFQDLYHPISTSYTKTRLLYNDLFVIIIHIKRNIKNPNTHNLTINHYGDQNKQIGQNFINPEMFQKIYQYWPVCAARRSSPGPAAPQPESWPCRRPASELAPFEGEAQQCGEGKDWDMLRSPNLGFGRAEVRRKLEWRRRRRRLCLYRVLVRKY